MQKKTFCQIRKDLKGMAIPLDVDKDKGMFLSNFRRKYQYRWTDDIEGFFIFFRGRWRKAYSIDFNFLN